jgi:hypothetical protein
MKDNKRKIVASVATIAGLLAGRKAGGAAYKKILGAVKTKNFENAVESAHKPGHRGMGFWWMHLKKRHPEQYARLIKLRRAKTIGSFATGAAANIGVNKLLKEKDNVA